MIKVLCTLFFMLCVSSVCAQSVQLAWDAPVNPDGSPVANLAGYTVHYGEQSGSYTVAVSIGLELTYTVTSLQGGHTYYFAVTARATDGLVSPFSNEVSAVLPSPLNPVFLVRGCISVPTLAVSPDSVQTGTVIGIAWTDIAGPSDTDWLGVYSVTEDNVNNYQAWAYVSCTRLPTVARSSGSCDMTVNVVPGSYRVMLFADDGFNVLATSQKFTVTP